MRATFLNAFLYQPVIVWLLVAFTYDDAFLPIETFGSPNMVTYSNSSEDPCTASKAGLIATTKLSRDSIFLSAKLSIQEAAKDRRERSVTFGRDVIGNITVSPVVNGDTTNGTVSANWPGAFADMHNHRNNQPPSAGDLYFLARINNKHAGYNIRFVLTAGGSIYALYLYNLKLANDFIALYPLEQSQGFSPRFPEPIFDEVDKVRIYFESIGSSKLVAQERAMAFVLDKYNTGVALLKQDSDGNFKKLQTDEVVLSGVRTYVATNCQ
jgi:hypothetical protein